MGRKEEHNLAEPLDKAEGTEITAAQHASLYYLLFMQVRVYCDLSLNNLFSPFNCEFADFFEADMSRIDDYNAQFASRFCAEDAEFQRYREHASDPPPVLEDWRARGRRDKR